MRKLACDLPVDVGAAGSTRVLPPRAKVAADLLAALGEALERRKRVTFGYRTMGSDGSGSRTVDPLGLFFLNQHWYLAARTAEDETVKNYRLSRMSNTEVNTRKPGTPDYDVPAGFDLREHARSRQAWELGAGDAVTAVIAFHSASGAAAGAARLGEEVEGKPHLRRFRVRRLDAFARWLLSFAGDLEPVSPARWSTNTAAWPARPSPITRVHRPPDRPTVRPPPMTDTAASQLSRILHLIPGSPTARRTTCQVSREVGADRKVVLRDIQSISERFEAPGGFVEGLQIFLDADGTVSILPNHFLRPMRLTRGELCALELGLAMLRTERPAEEPRRSTARASGSRKRSAVCPATTSASTSSPRWPRPAAWSGSGTCARRTGAAGRCGSPTGRAGRRRRATA